MIKVIPGFEIEAHLYESSGTAIFRAIRSCDNVPVILKINNREYPSAKEIARFENEFNIINRIDHDGVIVGFEPTGERPFPAV